MMWNVELAVVAGAGMAAVMTYGLTRMHCQNVQEDRHIEEYEKGWTDGYNSGYSSGKYSEQDLASEYSRGYTDGLKNADDAPVKKPAKRVKKIRKADP